jgi:hypothetical protein
MYSMVALKGHVRIAQGNALGVVAALLRPSPNVGALIEPRVQPWVLWRPLFIPSPEEGALEQRRVQP